MCLTGACWGIECHWKNTPERVSSREGNWVTMDWEGDLIFTVRGFLCHLTALSRAWTAHSKINKVSFLGCLLKRLQ